MRRDWVLLLGWVAALVAHRAARLTERDPFWQAREGLERLSGAPLSRGDDWSWAMPEGLFRPTSPLWNSALALGYDGLGVAGIALVGSLGMLAYFALAAHVARHLGARPLPTLVATVLVSLLAFAMISPRATVLIEALLLGVLVLAHHLVRTPARVPVWAPLLVGVLATALSWIGAWIHVSWTVTALGLAGLVPALTVLGGGVTRRRLVTALAASVGLVTGSSLGPYGLDVWRLLVDVSGASGGQVVEWLSPFTAGLRLRWVPVAALCLVLAGACALRVVRRLRSGVDPERTSLEASLVVVSLAAAVAGLFAIRFLGVAALTLLPVLGASVSDAAARWRGARRTPSWLRTRLSSAYWRPVLTGVLVVLLPLSLWSARAPGRPNPEAALAPDLPRACRLFADPGTSGAVLLLRRDVRVWVDMRTEVYGSEYYAEARRRLSAPTVSLPSGATCALLPSGARVVHVDGQPTRPWQRQATSGHLSVWLPA